MAVVDEEDKIPPPSPGRERAFTFGQAPDSLLFPVSDDGPGARAPDERKENMKQMVTDERNRIEFLAGCGRTIPQIAKELGRSPSTIRNELIRHRVDSDKRHGCSNRLCADYEECVRRVFDGFGERRRRNTPKCFRSCPDFREASCPRLARPPFVCNGCERERECPLRKKFYIASVAQAQCETERSLSRTGVHPDGETVSVTGPLERRGT